MLGDKGAPYLDNAHKATDNLIKMVTASHKLINKEEELKTKTFHLLIFYQFWIVKESLP